MADLKSKFKRAFGFDDEYEYEDDYDYLEEEETEDEVESVPTGAHRIESRRTKDSYAAPKKTLSSDMIITVHEPLSYDESPYIVDDLKERKAVVLNFEQLDLDVKREIFDFVNGALYAIEGKIQKVNKDIFILAPANIEIDGLKEELQNSGMFPW